jgi:hypothetical protein
MGGNLREYVKFSSFILTIPCPKKKKKKMAYIYIYMEKK